MKHLLNVLYILTADSYIYKQGETICVKIGGQEKVRVPVHTIESVVCFGNTTVSTPFIEFCGERGVGLTFLSDYGKFYGRINGPVHGNVLLRMSQYNRMKEKDKVINLSKNFVAAKIANSRNTLLRSARENNDYQVQTALRDAAKEMAIIAKELNQVESLDALRGIEGICAKHYFNVFDNLIKVNKDQFYFSNRNRRPPTDNVNALLSFIYKLLTNDICSALETVGLDIAAGFLHAVRPGRPSLALDILEELRSPLCDRFVISLINLKQLQAKDFESGPDGVKLRKDGMRKLITAWQARKKEEIVHPFIEEKIKIGLIPYVQAQLLARYLRGDLDAYPPFYWK